MSQAVILIVGLILTFIFWLVVRFISDYFKIRRMRREVEREMTKFYDDLGKW